MKALTVGVLSNLLLFSVLASAETSIRKEQVKFKKGESGATIKGTIKGDEIVDYILNAQKGQSMVVILEASNTSAYFNVMPPGSDEAIFIGSTSGNRYEGTLPASGDYTVRVYLMRNAARRGETANYTISFGVSGTQARASQSTDANVPGTPYHATGQVPCALASGQPTGSCAFGVVREGNGTATVTVTKPDGRTRAIFFEKGKAIGYDMSQADRGEFSATRQGDLTIVRIDQERYEIPDAVILGG